MGRPSGVHRGVGVTPLVTFDRAVIDRVLLACLQEALSCFETSVFAMLFISKLGAPFEAGPCDRDYGIQGIPCCSTVLGYVSALPNEGSAAQLTITVLGDFRCHPHEQLPGFVGLEEGCRPVGEPAPTHQL